MTATHIEPQHPVRGNSLTPLERDLVRFRLVANEVQVLLRGLQTVGRGTDIARILNDDLFFSLFNHGKILVCKFLEVWDDFGSLGKTIPRVREVRGAVTPIVDRIKVWPALVQFRNSVLAHPYLTKSGQLVDPMLLIRDGKAPTFHAEALLLLHCVNLSVLGILQSFYTEYRPLQPLLVSDDAHPGPGPGISRGPEIVGALRSINLEADARLAKIGVVVSGPLAVEFALSINPERFDKPGRARRLVRQLRTWLWYRSSGRT